MSARKSPAGTPVHTRKLSAGSLVFGGISCPQTLSSDTPVVDRTLTPGKPVRTPPPGVTPAFGRTPLTNSPVLYRLSTWHGSDEEHYV